MTWLLRLLIALAAMTGPITVRAQTTPRYYKVVLTIERDGHVIGTPTFITEPGADAIMSNSKAGYSFKVDVGTDGALPSSSIKLATELYFANNDRWELLGKPTIFVSVGQKSAIYLSNTRFGNVSITYSITTVANTSSNIQAFGKNRRTESRIAE